MDVIERRIFSKLATLRKVELTFTWFWLVLSTAGMDALDARFGEGLSCYGGNDDRYDSLLGGTKGTDFEGPRTYEFF